MVTRAISAAAVDVGEEAAAVVGLVTPAETGFATGTLISETEPGTAMITGIGGIPSTEAIEVESGIATVIGTGVIREMPAMSVTPVTLEIFGTSEILEIRETRETQEMCEILEIRETRGIQETPETRETRETRETPETPETASGQDDYHPAEAGRLLHYEIFATGSLAWL